MFLLLPNQQRQSTEGKLVFHQDEMIYNASLVVVQLGLGWSCALIRARFLCGWMRLPMSVTVLTGSHHFFIHQPAAKREDFAHFSSASRI